jgi:hypothetical protein
MEQLLSTALIFGLFVLRFIVPLVITAGAGYLLTRLDRRWQAEAEAERQAWIEADAAKQPALPAAAPAIFPLLSAPCWILKGCDPATRAKCPAYLHAYSPCWLTRSKAEGELPTSCLTCTLFAHDVGESPLLPQEVKRDALPTQPAARD